jgi:hypothetical protein
LHYRLQLREAGLDDVHQEHIRMELARELESITRPCTFSYQGETRIFANDRLQAGA